MAKKFWAFGLLLVAEYFFLFSFLLNYDLAWLNPEKLGVEPWVLANGAQWQKEDWLKFLNIEVLENNPDRLSRPLSNFVEVLDDKWRAGMWHLIRPHPALTLLWPLMLLVLPWLLFLTLRNMGCVPAVAATASLVYLSTLGFLGPMVMRFHPAKNLVNFLAVLTCFILSLACKRLPDGRRHRRWLFAAAFVTMFLGFMSDETGLYVYVLAAVVFFALWRRLWQQKYYGIAAAFLSLPVLYLITVKYLLPFLHWKVQGKWIDFGHYESYPSPASLFFPDWGNLLQNMRLLFGDHPHWLINYAGLAGHPVLLTIQCVYLAVWAALIFYAVTGRTDKTFFRLFLAAVVLMLGYAFFHTFQLSKNAEIWSIWWYGSLFSLVYVLGLAFFLQLIAHNRPQVQAWLPAVAAVFILNGLVFSTYRIAVFKMQNFDRHHFQYEDILNAKIDEYQYFDFSTSLAKSSCKKVYAGVLWREWKSLPQAPLSPAQVALCQKVMPNQPCVPINGVCLPVESLYLNAELK